MILFVSLVHRQVFSDTIWNFYYNRVTWIVLKICHSFLLVYFILSSASSIKFIFFPVAAASAAWAAAAWAAKAAAEAAAWAA